MWQVLKYLFTFRFLADFRQGQQECVDEHKKMYCARLRSNFFYNMVKDNETDDEFGLVD